MRKIVLLLIAIIVVVAGLQAQDYSGKITPGRSYKYINMNHTLTNADTVEVVFYTQVNSTFTLDAGMQVDSVSGTSVTDVLYVEGRIADDQPWVSIANSGVIEDKTLAIVVSHTTAVRYREIKVWYKATATMVRTADYAWLKVWYE